MDRVFRVDEQEFISKPVQFKKYLEEAHAARESANIFFRVPPGFQEETSRVDFAAFLGVSVKEAGDLDALLTVEHLSSSRVHYNFNVTEPSQVLPMTHHKTIQILKKEHEKRRNAQYKSVAQRQLKYDRVEIKLVTIPRVDKKTDCNGIECINDTNMKVSEQRINTKKEPVDPDVEVEVSDRRINPKKEPMDHHLEAYMDELVVMCSIFIGYNRPLFFHEMRLGRLLKVTDTILLTGSSTLLDLKNAFRCPSDFSFADDMSLKPPSLKYLSFHQFPSSFFFIDDTFYIDTTADNSIDMSKVIREWAARRKEIGELKVAEMKDTRIANLTARLGMPYVYVHQGQCEHLVCFNDLHLRETRDPPITSYPIKLNEKNFRRISCAGCKMATAEWVTLESHRLPTTPSFVCDPCYREFHLTGDGDKVGAFLAVPYCDRKAMDTKAEFFLDRLREKAEKYKK